MKFAIKLYRENEPEPPLPGAFLEERHWTVVMGPNAGESAHAVFWFVDVRVSSIS